MSTQANKSYNPNPITKMLITILIGLTVLNDIGFYFEFGIVLIISVFFYLNGFRATAVKGVLVFGVLSFLPTVNAVEGFHPILKMFFLLFIVIRMFYLPYYSGKFLIKTSDVGSIVSSMDKVKIPQSVSIPLAVMFRYFPSFKEEKDNVKTAMKIRGITFKNPIAYLEYVTVPLLVISSNIADDISKAAETRCIGNPITKTRYTPVKLTWADIVYVFLILTMVIGGWLW